MRIQEALEEIWNTYCRPLLDGHAIGQCCQGPLKYSCLISYFLDESEYHLTVPGATLTKFLCGAIRTTLSASMFRDQFVVFYVVEDGKMT